MSEKDPAETSFGEELKRHRLLREVSLESIAAATKISARHLQALERGDFGKLPAPVFTRGFIRAYAAFLGLDPEEMVNAYLSEVGASGARSHAGSAAGSASRKPSVRAVVLGVVAAAVAVLIAAGVWRYVRRPRPEEPKALSLPPVALSPHIRQVPPSTGASPAPPAADAPSSTSAPVSAAPVSATVVPAAAGAPPVAEPLTLALSTREECWMEIFADDRLLFSGTLRGGEARTFEARRSFRLTAGNAGAVRVTVNGRALPPLGQEGEVVRDVRLDAGSVNELLSRGQ
ncbi:MAG TPA: RodZ domain-containing protein [Thermoanaerobaculia bacterium]|nr:RodZ domain-containing protein [Thermoanaerobaculia bacterium]